MIRSEEKPNPRKAARASLKTEIENAQTISQLRAALLKLLEEV